MHRFKPFLIFALAASALLTMAPLAAPTSAQGAAAGGAVTGDPDFVHTHVGALMIPAVEGGPRPPGYEVGQYFPAGSGTLIHERVFLTAGHVTRNNLALIASGLIPLEQMYITFDQDPSGVTLGDPIPSTWRPIANLITHPGFVQAPRRNDTGVVILEEPVSGITPAALPSGLVFDYTQTASLVQSTWTVVGYGARMEFSRDPTTFLAGLPPIQFFFDELMRKFALVSYNTLDDDTAFFKLHVDAADATVDQAAGLGDSGGPIFLEGPGGSEIVAATVIGPASARFMGAQRLDIPEVRAFIDLIIASLDP